MNDITKKNLPLILGLSIPLAMIVLIAAFIYIPRWNAPQPQNNFLYMIAENGYYSYDTQYDVSNGHLTKTELPTSTLDTYPKPLVAGTVRFFSYNVTTNQAQELTFEEAQKLNLNSSLVSPDGYEVVMGSGGSNFPFGGSNDYTSRYLKGHGATKKLNIQMSSYNYYDFRFLGWINR